MSILSISEEICWKHPACSLHGWNSGSASCMRLVRHFTRDSANFLERQVAARLLCISMIGLAALEGATHLVLGALVLTGALANRAIVHSLKTLSWSILITSEFVYAKILSVSTPHWILRIVCEVGFLVTNPVGYLIQWKERINLIFWTKSWDSWLWDISKTIDKKFSPFLNGGHGLYHLHRSAVLTVSSLAIPLIGILSPKSALKKSQSLGIEPHRRSRILACMRRHAGKIVLTAGILAAIAYDYRNRGFTSPENYVADLKCQANALTEPLYLPALSRMQRVVNHAIAWWTAEGPDWKSINASAKMTLEQHRLTDEYRELAARVATLEKAHQMQTLKEILKNS